MKKYILLLTGIFLLCSATLLAQKTTATKSTAVTTVSKKDIEALPFSKGKWEFDIARQEAGYNHQNIKSNSVYQGNQNQIALNLGTNYYVANHIGVGLELNTSWSAHKNNSYRQINDSWMTYANLTYGTSLSDNIGFYARAGIGLGGLMNKYEPYNGTHTKDKSDLFGYKINFGLPIQLGSGPVYLTPEVGYRYKKDNFTGGDEVDDRFCFGVEFETYLFCREMQCDAHMKHAFSINSYDQGNSYFGVTTKGNLNFGTATTTYDNPLFGESKQKYSDIDLQANYMYYIVHDLALGANVDFSNSVSKFPPSSTKESSMGFSFMPMLELNMPSKDAALSNLFVRSGYGFGVSNDKSNVGGTTSTIKYNSTGFCAGLGYNFFFHKGLAFTPLFEYDINTMKNKTTDVKTKYSGPEIAFGVRKFFGK